MSMFNDEKGKTSMGRALLLTHTFFNWIWIWLLILGWVKPEGDVLNMLMGLDGTMFIVFGGWVIGPRSFQHLFPQLGAVASAAGKLVGRARGTDDRHVDDERDP